MVVKTASKATIDKIKKRMHDFEWFAKSFVYIVDTSNQKVRFNLNLAQTELNQMIDQNRFIVINKARKAGISTYMLAKALYRCIRNENESILIVSYKADSSKYLFETLKKMNEWLPREKYPELFPATKRDNRDELLLANGSRIVCCVAGTKEIARGFSPTWVHLSEFAYYENQEKQLNSVEQALIDTGKITIETTSAGMGNYYYKLFMSALKGNSKYKPYFIPFFHELYRKQFKNQHDEAEAWFRATNKGQRLSEKNLEKEEKLLFVQGASLNFLMWRRYKLLDMSLNDFYQEYPSNPHESFISSGTSIFEQSKILEQMTFVLSLSPLSQSELSIVPEKLKPYIGKGLDIFRLPKRGMRYFAGVDVSAGSKNDYSTVCFFDSDGQQCASFYRNDIPIYKFAEIVREIGLFFNYAYLVIERNGLGISLIERLRKDTDEPYLNMFKHRQFDKGKSRLQLGWLQTANTKSGAISDGKEMFECGLINILCKELLTQMQTYTEENARIDGHHHDLVQAFLLAIQGMKSNKYYVEVG